MENIPANKRPLAVDPRVVQWMAEMSVRLVGRDNGRPGHVIWRREPVAQGDATRYEFSTLENITLGGYFLIETADAIYEAGYKAGQGAVQARLQRLLGYLEPT